MATIGPISIAADADDGQIGWGGAAWTFYVSGESGNSIYTGDWSTQYNWGFFRFIMPSAVPAGATFDAANCKLELYGTDTYQWVNGTDDIVVYATAANNAAQPQIINDRPAASGGETVLTTAYAQVDNVTWATSAYNSLVGTGGNTIAAILSELHTAYGLDSGDAIVLWVRGNQMIGVDDGHQVGVEDYSNAGTNPARLTIVYTEGGGSVPLKKILNTYRQRRA